MLLSRLLRPLIREGTLTVVDATGRAHRFGTDPEPAVTIRLHHPSLHWRLALKPELYAGEAFMDGTLTVENASLYAFLDLIGRNLALANKAMLTGPFARIGQTMRRAQQFNPARRARRNAAHHYNLSYALYGLFLDQDRQYSCAYFADPQDDLETAQLRKKQHIAAKLQLEPGMRVLDIGCGWGGLALFLADRFGAEVTGITLAEEQLSVARARAAQAGLSERAHFHLCDYRELDEKFDRIVSVGMFEHVGVSHFDAFFGSLDRMLADDGVALIHAIGRASPPGGTNPWLRKYIFPGGYSPALSEIAAAVERRGLWMTDVEVLRLHYAQTLEHWRERFLANRDRVRALYDDRFCRMWEFYLAAAEISFRYLRCCVFQMQISKQQDAVPLVRDYMVDVERELHAFDGRQDHRVA
jgi:cyclopropane-fatty-acyl-phospholipid synthase